jgi:NTE family protein
LTDAVNAEPGAPVDDALVAGRQRLGLALGGGAARGLAHIGVLDVLEREGIRADCIAGSSMGGLIGALSAAGLRARDILEAARHFHFPAWFVFGRTLTWEAIFPSAARILDGVTFRGLETPLLVTSVNLESGSQVILDDGPVLPAVRATCAVPGVLPPENLHGQWLADGGVLNVLPVDVAWTADPDVVMAVNVGGLRARRMPQLDWRMTSALSLLGRFLPNPATAKVSFEVLVRATEIVLAHQTALATAMTGPEVVVEPRLADIGVRDFHRLDEAVDAGRRAAEETLPDLLRALDAPARPPSATRTVHLDPVCGMVVSPGRARARTERLGETFYFCSENCRDCFERAPMRYLRSSVSPAEPR